MENKINTCIKEYSVIEVNDSYWNKHQLNEHLYPITDSSLNGIVSLIWSKYLNHNKEAVIKIESLEFIWMFMFEKGLLN